MGRAVALLLASVGSRVMVADVDAQGGAETIERTSGRQMCFVQTDVSDERQVASLVESTVSTMGGLDILVNCAGVTAPLGVERCDLLTREGWQRTIDTNLTGTWLCIKYAAPVMMQRGGGAIVNFSSVAGMRAFPGIAPYCAAKAGILMLTHCAALEYVSYGIRVNAVCPGTIDTPMIDKLIASLEARGIPDAHQMIHTGSSPMKRLGTAEEVARTVLFLASEEASFVTGTEVVVDGGALA
jgi:NAD(P)-dependent dehydrogenase (short-subunit alcohol dehydrogenase family)